MDLGDREFIGRIYGTYKIIDIVIGNVINSVLWKMKCIYCNKEIEISASKVVRDYLDNRLIKCDCGCNVPEIEDIENGRYVVGKIDRDRLKKIRYNIIKKSTDSEHGIVEREWVDSLDNFIDWAVDNGYRPYKRLYRKSLNGGYTVENCYWDLKYGRKDKGDKVDSRVDISYTEEIENIAEKMRLSNGGISIKLYNRIDRDIGSIVELVSDFEKYSKSLILLGGVDPKKIDNILLRLSKAVENIEIVKEEMGLNG